MPKMVMTSDGLAGYGNRYCASCGHGNGELYLCPSYSTALKAEIVARQTMFTEAIRRLPNNPLTATFKAFAGVDPHFKEGA